MTRSPLSALLAALAFAAPAAAAPGGEPARPMSIGNWRMHDPIEPRDGAEPWTASDVVGFLQLHPDAYVDLGFEDGVPPGNYRWRQRGAAVAELRAIAAQRDVDVRGRLCMSERLDVMTRLVPNAESCFPPRGRGCDWEGDMDGRLGEAEPVLKVASRATGGTPTALADGTQRWSPELYANRLVVLRPRAAGQELRRVVSSEPHLLVVDRDWDTPPRAGDAYEIRGSFDPAWVQRVPRSVHAAAIRRFWTHRSCGPLPCRPPAEPLDPFDPGNQRGWEPWVDRERIESLLTSASVPALYGNALEAGDDPERLEDPYYRANAVVLDVTQPSYQAWRARYLLYKLADHGFAPGDGACVLVAYKPGLHVFHDEAERGPGTMACSEADTNTWTGPSHVCRDGSLFGGPLHPTQFAAGAYEDGVNASLRALLGALESSGYSDVRVITAEAPMYGETAWTILADDVRRHPKIVGAVGGWIEPSLSELAAVPDAPTANDGSDAGAAPPADLAPTPPAAPRPPAAPTPPTSPSPPASPPSMPASPPSLPASPPSPPASPPPADAEETSIQSSPPGSSTSWSLGSGSSGGGASAGGGSPSATGSGGAAPSSDVEDAHERGDMKSSSGGGGDGTVEAPSQR